MNIHIVIYTDIRVPTITITHLCTGHDVHSVLFLTRSGDITLSRTTAIELMLLEVIKRKQGVWVISIQHITQYYQHQIEHIPEYPPLWDACVEEHLQLYIQLQDNDSHHTSSLWIMYQMCSIKNEYTRSYKTMLI